MGLLLGLLLEVRLLLGVAKGKKKRVKKENYILGRRVGLEGLRVR